jgi:transcriptional regulator with XRE-family HTH domain
MNISKRKDKLIKELQNKEHREAFISAQIDIGIAFQIRALREQRNETQAQLSERTGMAQAWISKLESPNYSGFSIATLKKVASAFDVGLMIRFVPISQLVEWELGLSNDSLLAPSLEDDPYFNEPPVEVEAISGQGRRVLLFDPTLRNPGADAAASGQHFQGAYFFHAQAANRESALS